jgi:hypothetical protein
MRGLRSAGESGRINAVKTPRKDTCCQCANVASSKIQFSIGEVEDSRRFFNDWETFMKGIDYSYCYE